MSRNTLICALLFIFPGGASAAGTQVKLILQNNVNTQTLASKLSTFEDPSKNLRVDDIRKIARQDRFKKSESGRTELGFTQSAMWLKLDIENRDHPSSVWVMELWSVPTDRADLFVYDGDRLVDSETTGGLIPGKLKRASYYGLKLNVPPGQKRSLFLRLESSHRMRAPLSIFTPDAIVVRDYQKQLVMGLLFGIGIALILYNLGLYYSIRDISYLLYSIYGITVWALIFGENGYVDLYLGNILPRWSELSQAAMATVLFTALFFARSFLKTQYLAPKVDIGIKIVLGLLVSTALISLVTTSEFRVSVAGKFMDLLILITVAMMIVSGVLTFKSGFRPAKLYLVSWSAALSMILVWLAEANGLIPTSVLTRFCAEIGIALEMILKSLGLADRVTVIREELVRVLANQKQDLEVRVRERTREIEVKNKVLAESAKMAALGEMAAAVAHEINNPLGIIVGGSEHLLVMLEEAHVDRVKTVKQADEIISTAMRMARIVRGLLAYSRKSGGDPFVHRKLVGIMEDTAEFCRQRLRQEQIELLMKPVSDDYDLLCHPAEISEVLVNLMNNSRDALRNLPEGERWISLEVVENGGNLDILVTDSGNGIPKAAQSKIFHPFFTTKELGQGTGLGLSISKGIAESHGGTLEYNPGSLNTQFILRLPRAQTKRNIKSAA